MAVLLVALVIAAAACGSDEEGSDGTSAGGDEACDTSVVTTDSGLQYEDTECGDGPGSRRGGRGDRSLHRQAREW